MKTTTQNTNSRIHAIGEEILGPVRAPHGSLQRRLLMARSVAAYGGLILTLAQLVVWLMIAVIAGRLDSPWWLWTAVPTAAVVVATTVADRWRGWWISVSDSSSTNEGEL